MTTSLRSLRGIVPVGLLLLAVHACILADPNAEPTPVLVDCNDGGLDGDVEVDAGDDWDGGPTPEDTAFSIGLTDNSGGIPQTASLVGLHFRRGEPSSSLVIGRRAVTPIVLDGFATDWTGFPESVVPMLSRGAAISMTQSEWDLEYLLANGRTQLYDFNITSVSVRAAYDDERIYFLLQWTDPTGTENRFRDGWYVDGGTFRKSTENEDRAYLAFNINKSAPAFEAVGCSAACHIRERLGDVSDAGRAYRFRMHTDAPGELIDYWQWRAATSDPMGSADDGYIDESSRKQDGMADWAVQNSLTLDGGVQVPVSMSEFGVNTNPLAIFKPDAGVPVAVPFDGTSAGPAARIPGWIMQRASPGRDDVRAVGRYSAGRWTVEFSRALTNSDTKDAQFPLR